MVNSLYKRGKCVVTLRGIQPLPRFIMKELHGNSRELRRHVLRKRNGRIHVHSTEA